MSARHPAERALARVDLGAVRRNAARMRAALTGGAELCAVVKADGYGHGELPCARAALAGGATWLGVATAPEAARLRRGGIEAPVLVQGALTGEDLRLAVEVGADVVAWRLEFAAAAAEAARNAGTRARVHVKLDTGMGRLGTKDPDEARRVLAAAADDDALEPVGVMTHFATADEPGDEHFPAQLAAFDRFAAEAKRAHRGLIAHAANSAAVLRDPAAHFDLARCGIAIYGLDPYNADPAAHGLEPALELRSYVAAVKRFARGESAGYGRTWRAERETCVATLPIGYGDGWRRALSNNADVLIRGGRHPLAGTVSMDNVTVDLGPDTDVREGDEAVLIGAQGEQRILCEDVARRLGTINYEVTCGLTARVRRAHVRG